VDCISFLFAQSARLSRSTLRRWITAFELPRTRQLEAVLPGWADRVLVTSESDRVALEALRQYTAGRSRVDVLSNGVDTDYYRPRSELAQPGRLVFTGRLGYHANLTAALDLLDTIMPLVWRRFPEARLTIAGEGAARRLRSAVRREPRVELCSDPRDLRPIMSSAVVAVAPMRYAAGIQNKVLEALASGLPVVASSSAVRALSARAGEDLLVADEPPAFADQVVTLLGSETLRRRFAARGRSFVEREHNWSTIVRRLETIYAEVAR
jgi:glycosyltransferase involved in cell wall biosynthesis